jgi:hypothetical protein
MLAELVNGCAVQVTDHWSTLVTYFADEKGARSFDLGLSSASLCSEQWVFTGQRWTWRRREFVVEICA